MFYTKYRPQKFSEISKPNTVAEVLATQVKSNKIGHAYLFIGPRGTGKTTTARILAKSLNCNNIEKNGDPCDKCDICEAIKHGNFLDLIEIDAASNRGIDDIRDLKDKIKLTPASGKHKVYIIDEVHMLTTEAFNALLKTLEEPPAHATFILCTTESQKVPDTIKSRCQVFKFKRAGISQIVAKLEDICSNEKVKSKIKKEDLEKIAKASLGGFRDAETMLQQVIEGEIDIDLLVGSALKQEFIDYVFALNSEDLPSALKIINKAYEDGIDLYTWTIELLKHLRELMFIACDADEGILDVTDEMYIDMEDQAAKIEVSKLVKYLEVFSIVAPQLKNTVISQLPLELATVKLCGDNSLTDDASNIDDFPKSPKAKNNDKSTKNTKASKSPESESSKLATDLDNIKENWSDVLKGVIVHNHGVQALLKATKPHSISGNSLVIEVFYKFHKERLESQKNKEIVESVLSDIFGEDISLLCILSDQEPKRTKKNESGELTDMNISVPSDFSANGSILDVFDGGLPL